MAKILQQLKILQMCQLQHAEHHAKNRTSPGGLDQDALFLITLFLDTSMEIDRELIEYRTEQIIIL